MLSKRTLALALGAILTSALFSHLAAESPDAQRIEKLIGQLGSMKFAEREAAQKELDTIGAPALEALKKAAKAPDAETRRRAEELVTLIERREQSARILKPTRVHLVCKEMPVPEAVADLAKKSGFNVVLIDETKKLADRRVTLDTGETTFWQALDQLCQKANLVETSLVQAPVPPMPMPPRLQPLPPRVRPGALPPVQPEEAPALPRGGLQAGGGGQAMPAIAAPALIQPGFANNNQITLIDGKPKDLPTHYAGAARVRALPRDAQLMGTPRKEGEILFGLNLALEPRVPFQGLKGIRIDKAVDDQGQSLAPVMTNDNPGPVNPAFIGRGGLRALPQASPGPGQQVPVRLKAGDKAAKALKELTGAIAVEVRTPAEPLMTVDDVLKAAGKTVKGKDGGAVTVKEVTKKENGEVVIRVELELPPGANGGFGGFGAPIQIMPALPAPAPAPAPAPRNGLQVQIQIRAVAQPIMMAPAGSFDHPTPALLDAKGKAYQLTGTQMRGVRFANNVMTEDVTLIFRPQQGQTDPAQLVYSGTRAATIEVPFTLKDVQLP